MRKYYGATCNLLLSVDSTDAPDGEDVNIGVCPLIETVLLCTEPAYSAGLHTVDKSTQVTEFRFVGTPAHLRRLAAALTEYADGADSTLRLLRAQITRDAKEESGGGV